MLIPVPEDKLWFLTNRDWFIKKAEEYPELKLSDSWKCPTPHCINADRDRSIREETDLDKQWLIKIKHKPEEDLESGDRVYLVRRYPKV